MAIRKIQQLTEFDFLLTIIVDRSLMFRSFMTGGCIHSVPQQYSLTFKRKTLPALYIPYLSFTRSNFGKKTELVSDQTVPPEKIFSCKCSRLGKALGFNLLIGRIWSRTIIPYRRASRLFKLQKSLHLPRIESSQKTRSICKLRDNRIGLVLMTRK